MVALADYGERFANWLIDYGVDVNQRHHEQDNVLKYVCSYDYDYPVSLDFIKKLVTLGQDINFQGNDIYTPICYALAKKRLDIVKHLHQSGADLVLSLYESKTTVLFPAVDSNDLAMVDYLLSNTNVDVNFKNQDDASALYNLF